MAGIDWGLILASFAFTSFVFLFWILTIAIKRHREITKLNKRVQNILDSDRLDL